MKAAEAELDIADLAMAPLSGGTSQPNLNTLVEALRRDLNGGEGAPGYGDMKKAIMTKMDERFGEARERYRALMPGGARSSDAEDALRDGARRARSIARDVLARCYDAVGMDNAVRRLREG